MTNPYRSASDSVSRFVLHCLVLFGIGTTVSSPTWAQLPRVVAREVREYEILVKGKSAGSVATSITDTNDGRTTVITDACVTLDYIVYTYRYEYHGSEVWRGNRLDAVDGRGQDGHTKFAIRAHSEVSGSVVEVLGGGSRSGPVLAMTTNYWHSPSVARGNVLQVLDPDEGTIHATRIDDVTRETTEIAGRELNCTHYRLGGGTPVDLWFDDKDRLVREQTVEDGYPTESRLVRITSAVPEIARR
jgi:hypothetical protein